MKSIAIRRLLLAIVVTTLILAASITRADCSPIEKAIKASNQSVSDADVTACIADSTARTQSLIMLALEYRRDDVASALLEQGARPQDDTDAVAKAAMLELPLSVALLTGANRKLLEAQDASRAPLRLAAVSGAYRTAKLLLANGADSNYGNPLLAAIQENQIHIAHLLLEHGATLPEPSSPEAGDLLGAAVRETSFTFVDFLLSEGLNPNSLTSDGGHVLEHAPHHKNEAMGHNNWFQLTARGADVQSMVCRIDAEEISNIENNAPKWYANIVAQYRAACPR